jgi:hypothetical protein
MTREEYEKRYTELVSKFSPEFMEKCKTKAFHQKIFEALVYGQDVYKMLEITLDTLGELQDVFTEHIKNGPPPVIIGKVSDEIVREILSKK